MAYPLPVFHFRVEWGGASMAFTEVSGLTAETQPIEYRTGDMVEFSSIKMPGLKKYSNVSLKRGISAGDNELFEWLKTVQLNTVERRDITITLLNEEHSPVVTWSLTKAFPIKVEGPGLKASGNEVAIESMELVHEGINSEHS